ncbi:MerR family transcriptional regulator [Nonomuraea turkmeniaca]|uniref:MerR family transcriptional regulator n=2 Tax=Nonomuraea turkmeniaca TaxID=103838 RepID=A0A5S4FHP1_9ACTN|nr:MerR family transcriptional regulator [Nonomuraea turkmeniaca]
MTSPSASALVEDETLPIAEVARRTGLSADTLRYYEKAGLIDSVRRTAGGVRRYAAGDMDWLAFLLRLRDTGMSIADMQRFAEQRREGDASVAERLALLREHRDCVDRRIRSLRENNRALDNKIAHYEELLEGER